ncbi:MAG: hypothetical protein ACK5QX_05390, partial [bacterium]
MTGHRLGEAPHLVIDHARVVIPIRWLSEPCGSSPLISGRAQREAAEFVSEPDHVVGSVSQAAERIRWRNRGLPVVGQASEIV